MIRLSGITNQGGEKLKTPTVKLNSSIANMSGAPGVDNARPFLAWQRISDWASEHWRCRTFNKDEKIPARPGLLYLVQKGSVRLLGNAQVSASLKKQKKSSSARMPLVASEEAFLGFVGVGQPFEVVAQPPFTLQSFAHVDDTTIIWLYWNDLDTWPHFQKEVLDAFRRQHQRKLLWLSTLGQRRTIDRLLGFLTLLIDEHGEQCERGYYLPFTLTHAQIGSAIGSTRVTVTRLIGKLRRGGFIESYNENLICLRWSPTFQQTVIESADQTVKTKPWKPSLPSINVKDVPAASSIPDIVELFDTEIEFPEEVTVGKSASLEISLLTKLSDPRGTRTFYQMADCVEISAGELGVLDIFIHVTATGLLLQEPLQVLRFNPKVTEHQNLAFEITATSPGEHIFEVEFFFNALRIGYVLIETLAKRERDV